jgi:hypothetical protein
MMEHQHVISSTLPFLQIQNTMQLVCQVLDQPIHSQELLDVKMHMSSNGHFTVVMSKGTGSK